MKWTYKILRALLLTVLALAVTVPVTLYVLLSLPSVQQSICHRTELELTRLLGVEVDIDRISISPFNRVTLYDVTATGSDADTILTVDRLGGGVSLKALLHHRLVFNYAELIGMDARISRVAPDSALNIQPIIDALKPKDRTKPPKQFDFRINTVVIRSSKASYNVLSEPETPGRFNKNHIRVTDLRADVQLPRMANDDFTVNMRRLAMRESSGLELRSLAGWFHIGPQGAEVKGLTVELPVSKLMLGDMAITYSKLSELGKELPGKNLTVDIQEGSHLATADLVPLVPALDGLDMDLGLTLKAAGTIDDIALQKLQLHEADRIDLRVADARVAGLRDNPREASVTLPSVTVEAAAGQIGAIISKFTTLKALPARLIDNMGAVKLDAEYEGTVSKGELKAELSGAPGSIDTDLTFVASPRGATTVKGRVSTTGFSGATLMAGSGHALEPLGDVELTSDFDLTFMKGRRPQGMFEAAVPSITYRGHTYNDIDLYASIDRNLYSGGVHVDNPGVLLDLTADVDLDPADKKLEFHIDAQDVDLAVLNLVKNTHGRKLTLSGEGSLHGPDIDRLNGQVRLSDIDYTDAAGNGLRIDGILLEAASDSVHGQEIRLASDMFDAYVTGRFHTAQLPKVGRSMVERVLPNLLGRADDNSDVKRFGPEAPVNELQFDIRVKDLSPLADLVKLPVKVIYPININGGLDSRNSSMNLSVDAPYLQQGNRLIENTALRMGVDASSEPGPGRANMYFTTQVPTKKGDMTLTATAFGSDGHLDTQVSWHVLRERRFNGDINLTTSFSRDTERHLITTVNVNPGKMVFNDTVWTVSPSKIQIEGKRVQVNGFKVDRPGQYVTIDGVASADADDVLKLSLRDISLDYVFETLDISTAMFGGNATGDFFISSAFTPNPVAYTPALDVRGLTYNYSLLGDARINSSWDPVGKAVKLNALIKQADGKQSIVDGKIMPMADSLDLTFDADRIPIGFLKPFMSAFATDVSGFATGHARLWGSFKLIDMVGDIYGEDVSITLGFTNTRYTCTDSVRLTPGRIDCRDITLHDMYGHTAKLNGWVTHKCFKEPSFNFDITDANSLLVYDVKESPAEKWYGHVFGNGWASVHGVPGKIDINAGIATAAGSNFTFVLSDALQAYDYDFITFRDRDKARKDSLAFDPTPEVVRALKDRIARSEEQGTPTVYDIDITADVKENTQVNLVMDPVAGDRIKAYGSGVMRMTYGSSNDELRLFGTYTLARGDYNFTFQDIIIKEFNIREGSSITFNGDPYLARLDITATYSTNANLSDLDESFLQDKELKRTNVPVSALLNVTGDMRRPDITFGLEFPTLTSDIKRKVMSIVNTEDMMNRQIIYLLALNRFYTPEYMSATKGNELVSVASSTISSQLSNMLGQLSDKWSISPNFRSDRGDFSDVEVDLALSSHLLNNRLLLNGNFGYRDKALNSNSFIGDFDIEYLLNRSGSIRLKAYNRYNDQNYYLKSSLTTQGVGVVFKRDFDDLLSFLKPLRRRHKQKADTATRQHPDSATIIVTDTITIVPIPTPAKSPK